MVTRKAVELIPILNFDVVLSHAMTREIISRFASGDDSHVSARRILAVGIRKSDDFLGRWRDAASGISSIIDVDARVVKAIFMKAGGKINSVVSRIGFKDAYDFIKSAPGIGIGATGRVSIHAVRNFSRLASTDRGGTVL